MLQLQRTLYIRFLNCGKFLMFPLLCYNVCVMIIMIIFNGDEPTKVNSCYLNAVSNEMNPDYWSSFDCAPKPLEDVLLSEEEPAQGQAIFFLETGCECSDPNYFILTLSSRQACSIESAALHYPNYTIFVLSVCSSFHQESDPIIDAILSYSNVKLRRVNLWKFAADSPVEQWIKTDKLFRSIYLVNNISNLLRLLTLYRYGGIYLDMDMLVVRPFEDNSLNFVGAEKNWLLGNTVIGLRPNGIGHKLAELLLRNFQENYDGNIWAHNGPRRVTEVMSYICNTNNITLMQEDQQRCQGIKVYRMKDLYEIQGNELWYLFEQKFAEEALERIKKSYLVHLWNHDSSFLFIKVDSTAAYMQLAALHCPKVFAATDEWFD